MKLLILFWIEIIFCNENEYFDKEKFWGKTGNLTQDQKAYHSSCIYSLQPIRYHRYGYIFLFVYYNCIHLYIERLCTKPRPALKNTKFYLVVCFIGGHSTCRTMLIPDYSIKPPVSEKLSTHIIPY